MDSFVDYYALLEIGFDASWEDVKAAYKRKAKQYHPDLNRDDQAASAIRFRRVKEAYDKLNEPGDRERYDRDWQAHKGVVDPFEFQSSRYKGAQVSEDDWDFACRYFPDLSAISQFLKNFGDEIEVQWRNLVFFEKLFSDAAELAKSAEEMQLARMVGTSEVLQMVARDALLAKHDPLLSELANSLRIFGSDTTEKLIERLCASAVSESPEIDVYDAVPVRVENYRNKSIKLFSDLTCTSNVSGSKRIAYIFQARYEIDMMLDSATNYQFDKSTSSRTRRK